MTERREEQERREWDGVVKWQFCGCGRKNWQSYLPLFPLFSFLSSQCFPLRLVCEGCLLESSDLWPLAAAHMFALKALDWIMPVLVKWGEETFAKSWPWGTLFLCGLIWAVPAKHTAKKDSWKYFLVFHFEKTLSGFFGIYLTHIIQILLRTKHSLYMFNAVLFKTFKQHEGRPMCGKFAR